VSGLNVAEGTAGAPVTASVSVTLAGSACSGAEVATVVFQTTAGSALSGTDFSATTGTVTLSTSASSQQIQVPIIHDLIDEPNESFTIRLTGAVGTTISGTSTTTVTILDNDDSPVVRFASNSYTVQEGATPQIAVSLYSAVGGSAVLAGQTITVNYQIADGTAVHSSDYTGSQNSTLTFTAGEGTKNVPVTIVNDSVYEWPEDFTVTLSSPSGATLGTPSVATVNVYDPGGLDPISVTGGHMQDRHSGTSMGCYTCSSTVVFESYVAVVDGSFEVDADNLCEQGDMEYDPDIPDGGGGEDDGGGPKPSGCQLDSFKQPRYQSRNSGATPIETRVTLRSDVPDHYKLEVTLKDWDGDPAAVSPDPVYSSPSGTSAGQTAVMTALSTGLTTGFYTYESEVTADYATGTDPAISEYGAVVVVNRDGSEFGDLWWLDELDRLYIHNGATLPGPGSPTGDVVALVRGDGTTAWWKNVSGSYVLQSPGSFSTLTAVTGQTHAYELTTKLNEKFLFYNSGYLYRHLDPQGNQTTYSYSSGTSGRLTEIEDPLGRITTFDYDENDKLESITDFAGRVVSTSIASDKLASIAFPDPDGAGGDQDPPFFEFHYYTAAAPWQGHLQDITYWVTNSPDDDPTERTVELAYDETGAVSEMTNPDGSSWTLESIQAVTMRYLIDGEGTSSGDLADMVVSGDVEAVQTDELGNSTTFTVDGLGNTTSITDALDRTTTIGRDANGLVDYIQEPGPTGAPVTTDFTYDNKGNVTRIDHSDGTYVTYSYVLSADNPNKFGIPTRITDEMMRETIIGLDSDDGTILSVRQKVGSCEDNVSPCIETDDILTTFTYMKGDLGLPDGLMKTMTDPLQVRTVRGGYSVGSARQRA
jgi:YD repeat-containing protein